MRPMQTPSEPAVLFGPFRLDLVAARLTRDGSDVALRPKAFELLAALARRPGEMVSKDELLDTVWGRRFITEGVIKSVVGELRAALGESPKQPRWIETVPRRGYRFMPGDAPTATLDDVAPTQSGASPLAPNRAAGNLPAVLAPPIGRAAELAAIPVLLAAQRLVTLVGPSGIGKTRLAQALAAAQRDDWHDGVWFVELAPLAAETTGSATLCATLAQVLHLGGEAAADAQALARALQPMALLLVVDNAEHLLEPLATLLAAVLAQAPALRLLVTSQEPLRIPGEQVFRLAPLALPPPSADGDPELLMGSSAVQLFVERVAARLPGFRLAPQQQQAVADICRALDGLPLALELAAARVPLLGVHGIAQLLLGGDDGSRLQLLNQGARTAAPRQRTLRAALQWSHDLLNDTQRRVFRRLGVFQGGFSLAAARHVCADATLDGWVVLDAIDALFEKSLLSALVDAETGGEPEPVPAPDSDVGPRYTLLASPRVYALERLAEAGEVEATRDRHLQAVLNFWARAEQSALAEPALPWLARQIVEIDNLRAAMSWAVAQPALADEALALAGRAALLWHRAGLVGEGRAANEAVRAQAELTLDPLLRLGFDLGVATLALYGSAYAPAEALVTAQRAADGFQAAGDAEHAHFACYLAWQLSLRAGLPREPVRAALLARMQAQVQPGWEPLRLRYLNTVQGYELRLAGQTALYLTHCREELALCRRLGAVAEGWTAAHGLMLAEHDSGHVDAALDVGARALAEIRAAGRQRQHGTLLALWTTIQLESGPAGVARRALADALPVLRSTGTPWMLHCALAWLAQREGHADSAARLLGWHDAALRRQGQVNPGELVSRSLRALNGRLLAQIGPAALAAGVAAGALLDDDAAERLAFDGPG